MTTENSIREYVRPTRPVINRGDPLARGLIFDIPSIDRGGQYVTNLVNGEEFVVTGGAAWVDNSRSGYVLNLDGSADYVDLGDIDLVAPVTWQLWIFPFSSSADRRLFSPSVASTGTGMARYNGSTVQVYDGAAWQSIVPSGVTLNDDSMIVGRYTSTALMDGFLDGDQVSTDVTVNDFDFQGGEHFDLFGNFRRTFGNRFKGRCYLFRLWDRSLSDQEVIRTSIDPWSLYRFPKRRYFVAGGAPPASTVPVLDEGMLVGGLQPLAGGLH